MFILIAFMLMALVSGQLSKEDKTSHIIAGEPTRYLIELGPGIQRWVTEEEKWELRLVCFSACYHQPPYIRIPLLTLKSDTERAKVHGYHRRTRYGFNNSPDPKPMGRRLSRYISI